ncbi:MAG: branched-chain amino acid ABC transporter substrate-binding protein [Actinobacteria bacterium]|nr:branched-chain amino acid ABC transporter substrate-binding protein [Actinomycetota bacterium]
MSGVARAGWRVLALLVLSASVLVACGGEKKPSTKGPTGGETVTIGFVGPLTGANVNLGVNIRDGVKVAVEEENELGVGPRIALKEFDTAGDEAQASRTKDNFIGDESVVGIVGPSFSGETKQLIPALQQAGLVMITPSATHKDLATVSPDATVFHRVIADDAFQAAGITEYLVKERPRSVAYVHDNSEYGKGLTDEVEKLVTARGIAKAASATVNSASQDFSATVNALKTANPTTIFYGGYYAEAGRLKKQLIDAGLNASFVSGDKSLDPGFVTAAGDVRAEGARLTCACNLASETAKDKKLKTFHGTFKTKAGREPGVYSPEAYDAAKLLIKGIKEGSKDRPALLKYVEDLKTFKGISKSIAFQPNGNLKTKSKFFVFQVKMGKIEPLQEVKVV